jgi:adenosine deaminase
MDFIRASVKALFYDYPVDTAIQIAITGSPSLTGEFAKLVNARERCYTQASVEALRVKLCNEWMGGGVVVSGTDEIIKAFHLPCLYAGEVLDGTINEPTVRFRYLFRWSELARYVGEDLMTVNYLAKRDYERGIVRDYFEWDAVLQHNNEDLNAALRANGQGWCDIHLHLGATTDVFELSWVSLMNNIKDHKYDFSMLTHPLDSPILVTKTYNYEDLYRWCVLAAMIRWELYKKYSGLGSETFGESFESEFSRLARQMPMFFRYELRNLQCLITDARKKAMKTSDGDEFDYAIVPSTVNKRYERSPFMIYHGERWLLYQYYYSYWSGDSARKQIGKYVYLYELIKNQLRRELQQVNELPGLGNFQEYNRRKNLMVDDRYMATAYRYAVQTTMRNMSDGMEARIMPANSVESYKKIMNFDYHHHLFCGGVFTTESDLRNRMTFVVHFLKEKCCRNNRHSMQRTHNRELGEILMEKIYKKETERGLPHRIVGIDVAGGETRCRPEVFAHLFRYCRKIGMRNFTYHVGEDFYDITEGLRSIDETVRFLQLTEGNRLGHCIALGIDAKKYYAQRHKMVVMPKQLLLDNIVWLLNFCDVWGIGLLGIRDPLKELAEKLYVEIGYEPPCDIASYYRSMLLRGNDFKIYHKAGSCWLCSASDDSPEAMEAMKDGKARWLCEQYFMDPSVYTLGFLNSEEFEIPYLYDRVIKKVQNRMMKLLIGKKICVETNPTSNVRIGRLGQYDELPTFRFSKIRKRPSQEIQISVNTDDKGIFATSLYREYSLLALALIKQKRRGEVKKWDRQTVYQYVGHLAGAGQKQRFRA